jgi:hypothetical protein
LAVNELGGGGDHFLSSGGLGLSKILLSGRKLSQNTLFDRRQLRSNDYVERSRVDIKHKCESVTGHLLDLIEPAGLCVNSSHPFDGDRPPAAASNRLGDICLSFHYHQPFPNSSSVSLSIPWAVSSLTS